MPFTSLTHPNLPLGIFKSQLAEAGIESRVFNLNLFFAKQIGYSGYESIAFFKGVETQVAEWLFAHAAWRKAFGYEEEAFLDLCGEELENLPKIPDKKAWLRKIKNEVVPQYLEACLKYLASWQTPKVIGFSCTFFQTVSSLALGRLIKERYPEVKLIYGGACFHGEMGMEIMKNAPWIDAISVGEADDVMVPLVEAMMNEEVPKNLQGIVYRDEKGNLNQDIPHTPVSTQVINHLPDPNYDDYFQEAASLGLDRDPSWRIRLLIPFESSRGCWWGQKHHCTFCGLNGQGMTYRGKDGEKVFEMLQRLSQKYPMASRFQASDNILEMSYFKNLVPLLYENPLPNDVELFYSVKSNMTRKQIKMLADANILYLQPGIESFSSHILKLMDKGVSGLQNLFFLKCCREYGITPFWNNLIRLPGEKEEDYQKMASWIPKILHFRPPYGGAPKIECHRFSPYFKDAEKWTQRVTPQKWYAGIFPEDQFDLAKVAYYFDAEWKDTLDDSAYDEVVLETLEWIKLWKTVPVLPQLIIQNKNEREIEIFDTRSANPQTWQLDELETAIYRLIDRPTNLRKVLSGLHRLGWDIKEAEVKIILSQFVNHALALEDEGKFMSIALREETVDPPFEWRRGLLKHSINNQDPNRSKTDVLKVG